MQAVKVLSPVDNTFAEFLTNLPITTNDLVVIEINADFYCARVLDVFDVPFIRLADIHKWIVCKVDLVDYTAMATARSSARTVARKLDAKVQDVLVMDEYNELATSDPEVSSLKLQLQTLLEQLEGN